jgi:5-methylcytosine-specific restriction protein A
MGVNRAAFAYHSRRITQSGRWQGVRFQVLRRDDFRCRQCGARGRLEVDHVLPVRTHPGLAWTLSNLQALCRSCHTYKTRIDIGQGTVNPARDEWRALLRKGL